MSVILRTGQTSLPTSSNMWALLLLQTWDALQPKHDEPAFTGMYGLAQLLEERREHEGEAPPLTLADIPEGATGMLGLLREHLVREEEQQRQGER